MSTVTTITEFLIEEQRQIPYASGDFTLLINSIVVACKEISNAVSRGNLADVLGSAGTENVQGETQSKLDVIANQILLHHSERVGQLGAMVSEEMERIYPIPEPYPRGKYLLLFDPLDGSTNIDVNGSIGTIFSVLRCPEEGRAPVEADFLQPGTQQVCAGYCMYGPSTLLVMTTGNGANGFTLDWNVGEFILTHPDIRIPEDTSEFAINSSNAQFWEPPVKRYIDECLAGKSGPRGKAFNMRWVGAMVADVHRIMTRGGVFLYPLDSRMKIKRQGGRLRLMYEANPIGFIVEQAGGLCSTGAQRILELQPENLHQRCPVIMGSKSEVERLIAYHLED